ncbi:hypothetical protein A2U01_0095271, partial [Trifolium medium]|nr:hypothetical protein [Trifolium medium]
IAVLKINDNLTNNKSNGGVGVIHVGGGTVLEIVLSSGGLEMYGDATAARESKERW